MVTNILSSLWPPLLGSLFGYDVELSKRSCSISYLCFTFIWNIETVLYYFILMRIIHDLNNCITILLLLIISLPDELVVKWQKAWSFSRGDNATDTVAASD